MSDDKIHKLHTVPSGSYEQTEGAYLTTIDVFLEAHNLMDLTGDVEADVELKAAKHDERRLGTLTPFERRTYALSVLLEVQLKDYLFELDANTMDAAVRLMREHKIPMHEAIAMHQKTSPSMSDEDMRAVNKLSVSMTHLAMMFEFSVRSRTNEFGKTRIIVRKGYVAYAFPMTF
jgi:hypothetical protein